MRAAAALLLLAALAARGDEPALDVARALADGETTPAEAAAAWQRLRLDPADALALVRRVPLEAAPVTSHRATLTLPSGETTDAEVVFPADGPEGSDGGTGGRWRLLVLLHGIGGDARQVLPFASGLAPPHTIIIAPTATLPPGSDAPEDLRRASSVGIDVMKRFKHWWSYREHSLALASLAYAARRWPLDRDRVVLCGYSMGGFGAWNVGLRFHDRFAGVAPLAGGLSREEMVATMLGKDPLTRLLLENAPMTRLFFVHGDEDDVVPPQSDRWSAEELEARGVKTFEYHEVKGGKHILSTFIGVSDALAASFRTWLAAARREPHPRRVVHRALGAYHGATHWLRLDELRGESAKVVAEVQGKNQVAVTTEGVARLTLFLDPALVDPKKRLQVAVDGRPAFQGVVRPSLLAVAESFARSLDPAHTFAHAVTLDVAARR